MVEIVGHRHECPDRSGFSINRKKLQRPSAAAATTASPARGRGVGRCNGGIRWQIDLGRRLRWVGRSAALNTGAAGNTAFADDQGFIRIDTAEIAGEAKFGNHARGLGVHVGRVNDRLAVLVPLVINRRGLAPNLDAGAAARAVAHARRDQFDLARLEIDGGKSFRRVNDHLVAPRRVGVLVEIKAQAAGFVERRMTRWPVAASIHSVEVSENAADADALAPGASAAANARKPASVKVRNNPATAWAAWRLPARSAYGLQAGGRLLDGVFAVCIN